MKGVGMLVVSLRGVNFGFWSHSPLTYAESPPPPGRQKRESYILYKMFTAALNLFVQEYPTTVQIICSEKEIFAYYLMTISSTIF